MINVRYNIKTISNIYNGKVAKYEHSCKMLNIQKCGSLLVIFLEETKDLCINKDFKTENGDLLFSMSSDRLVKRWGHSKSVWNRAINLFAILGLINKYDPGKVDPGNYSYWNGARLHRKSKVNKHEQATGEQLNDKIIQEPNLFYHTRYNKDLLEEAEARAKKLLDFKFSMGCASCIFYYRIFGEEITRKAFLRRNYKPGSIYSDFLSEAIKDIMYKQISEAGYTTKDIIYNALCVYYKKFKWWEAMKKEQQDPKKIYDLEFKRSIGIFLQNDSDLVLKKATKELVAVYGLKSCINIIYSKKEFKNRKG